MNKSLNKSTIILGLILLQGCNSVISRRTDEQAWLEFRKENQRQPASESELAWVDEIPVRTILLSCLESGSVKSCYRSKVEIEFNKAFQKSQKSKALTDDAYKHELKIFNERNSFEEVFSAVQTFHQRLLSGMDLRAVDHVRELHQECQKSGTDQPAIHDYQFFNGGVTDVPKGEYACLSDRWEKDVERLLDETTDRLSLAITSKEAREWIKRYQIAPVYSTETQAYFTKKQEEQLARWNENREAIVQALNFDLSLNDFVKQETRKLRAEYAYLALEPMLTEIYEKRGKK